MRAQIPGGRAVAARWPAAEPLDRPVAPDQPVLLLLAGERRGRHVAPAVMADLVAGCDHLLADLRVGLDDHAGHEPGRTDLVLREQGQDPPRADDPELAARDRGRRGHAARRPTRHHVEVEGQAGDISGHSNASRWRARGSQRHLSPGTRSPARDRSCPGRCCPDRIVAIIRSGLRPEQSTNETESNGRSCGRAGYATWARLAWRRRSPASRCRLRSRIESGVTSTNSSSAM